MMRKKTMFVVFTAVGGETQKDNKTALFWFWGGTLTINLKPEPCVST